MWREAIKIMEWKKMMKKFLLVEGKKGGAVFISRGKR